MSNYATLCYVPKIERLNYAAFLRNIRAYKSTYPIIFYSDEPEEGWHTINDPSPVKKSANRVGVQNLAFLEGLRIAEQHKLTRFIYLELDCRACRDNWDADLFAEAEQYKDMFCAGTPAVYNRHKFTPLQSKWVDAAIADYTAHTGFKVPEFKSKSARPLGCLFIMGGGAVFSAPIMSELFQGYERMLYDKAVSSAAFDLHIGLRAFQLFREKAVQKLPFLPACFSTYGNRINTEKERIAMARAGKHAVIHQVKSSDDCLN